MASIIRYPCAWEITKDLYNDFPASFGIVIDAKTFSVFPPV